MEEEGCKSNASLLIASCLPACSHDLTLADEMLVMEKTQDQGRGDVVPYAGPEHRRTRDPLLLVRQ
jgi:hypothetical protein